MGKDNFITRLLSFFLSFIFKEHEVSKEDMCKQARDICDKNCNRCAWNRR